MPPAARGRAGEQRAEDGRGTPIAPPPGGRVEDAAGHARVLWSGGPDHDGRSWRASPRAHADQYRTAVIITSDGAGPVARRWRQAAPSPARRAPRSTGDPWREPSGQRPACHRADADGDALGRIISPVASGRFVPRLLQNSDLRSAPTAQVEQERLPGRALGLTDRKPRPSGSTGLARRSARTSSSPRHAGPSSAAI